LAIFLVSIWSLTFYASRFLYPEMERLLAEKQFSTASFIAAAVNEELENRFVSIREIGKEITPDIVADPKALQAVLERHPFFQSLFNGGTYITGIDGTAIASLPLSAVRIGVNYMDRDHIIAALKEGKSSIGRPVMGKMLHAPVFSMATPLLDTKGGVVGALVGVSDLSKTNFLTKIADNHYGETGGYLLVAPQYRTIVTATDQKRIMETLPGPGVNPLTDRFIQGYEGSGIEINAHGAEELISARGVPVAGWYLAVSQPTANAFAPIHNTQQRILMAAILMTVLVVGLTWWLLSRLLAPMRAATNYLATQSNSTYPLQPLPIAHHDETGDLIHSFNQLLNTVALRDTALRDNQRQLSDIIKFLPTATLAIDKDGRVIIWNEAIEQLTGIPATEMLGKNNYAHAFPFHGEARPLLLDLILENNPEAASQYPGIVREEDTLRTEVFCSALGGHKGAWVFAKAAPLHDQKGNIVGAIESVRDITKRKTAETYGAIGRNVLQILNEPGSFQDAIQRVLTLLKTRTGFDAIGIRLRRGDDYPYFFQEGFSSEFLLTENSLIARTKDGEICRDPDGNVKLECTCGLVLSGYIDPTNPLFTPGGSCWTNNSRLLLELPANDDPRLHPRNQCIHHNYASVALVPIRDKEKIVGLLQFNDRRQEAFTHSLVEHLESIASHLGAALIRKQAEEENRHLQAQLVQAQKLEAIGTLAGGIAHDFNNILGAVIGYTEMAREDSPGESLAARYMDKVLEASNRAKNLVKQILAFSRQENIEPVLLNPEIIVREAAALLRPSLPTTIAIEVEVMSGVPAVMADPTQLHQIVINLATNAFHAMEATGGTMRLSLTTVDRCRQTPPAFPDSRPGLFVCLAVEDTGPGIPAVIRERIFEPFFTTKEVGRGTGMGLATVHGIVQKYGGFIICESEPGHGATFQVFLPAIAGGSTSQPPQEEMDETDRTGKGHILFVDDEHILVEMGQTLLERLGYEVTTRTNSLEALAIFQSNPNQFDAVITDQTMPGMTGIDLARRLLQIRPDLPIILCTGYSNLVDEDQARALGIKKFAMKPLTNKDIAALLHEVLTQAVSATSGEETGQGDVLPADPAPVEASSTKMDVEVP
jgi:PAS domain S-box-containing protein